jgi:hypothetical protein
MQSKKIESEAVSGKYRHITFCFLPQLLFVLLVLGVLGGGYWLLIPILFLLVVLPVLDLLTGWQDNVGILTKMTFPRSKLPCFIGTHDFMHCFTWGL